MLAKHSKAPYDPHQLDKLRPQKAPPVRAARGFFISAFRKPASATTPAASDVLEVRSSAGWSGTLPDAGRGTLNHWSTS